MQEIVLITGYNGAGKTTHAQQFVDLGYVRICRDELGGKIAALLPKIAEAVKAGKSVVADNTLPAIPDRIPFIELAKELGVPIRCVHIDASMEDAQLNACLRMMERRGKILSPEELKVEKDPNLFPPVALFCYKSKFENKKEKGACKVADYPGKQTPSTDHGFDVVEIVPFERKWGPEYVNKALILDADDTLRRSTGAENWPLDPSEIEILPGRRERLLEYVAKGYRLLGASNQSTHEKKEYRTPIATIGECFKRTNELLGLDIEWMYCPHYRFPVACYCRKPHAGMGAHFIWTYKLHPPSCTMVGDSTSDRTFADRCGFQFESADEFFA